MKTKFLIACLLAIVAVATAQSVKSKAEGEAVNAMLQATSPDAKIDAVEKLLAKFKDTQYKSIALGQAADAYGRKSDSVNAIIWGQRAIDADPKNYSALLLVSGQLAQTTGENDLDKDEKIKRGSKLANDAIAVLNTAPKPNPNLPDDQWTGIKKDFVSQAHETLGVFANVDKKYDVAIAEMKMAVDGPATPEASTMVRLANIYNNASKFDESMMMSDKVLAMAGTPDAVKKFAQNEKARAEKGKSGKK